ncbi:tetrapyrrole-binding protein, chloroplastic [Physcomitrium patens]|uniref:GUN4-like domain-containing protein n=1 Tax=Physcomitrium patens TaxID=3218 RepID=A0A2K1KF82_PHYPA|nr:tetrapyrrole-binding protein, chloroplastic-like [Physcomitrium patens]XP_024379355.1 tetrapyrrole-binding protein, chloroplastic-like [Physcomitrium patens]PNR52437.1 hypothetical protein PHYPA_008811 [Physcomitrium patens]|eukprot:XP_024379354.1 tetrapyrrole-binding protein, chloroplastic-like [Physcomitrella patens]
MALLHSSAFCVSSAGSSTIGTENATHTSSPVYVSRFCLKSFQSRALQNGVQSLSVGVRRSSTAVAVSSSKRDGVEKEVATTIDLVTDSGASLELLRDKLAAGEWEAADAETRRLLCVLAGEEAVKRKWVYFSEVKFISVSDLTKVDSLWKQYSNGKFGYSVQKKIWNNSGKTWNAFFNKVGWTRPLDEYQDTYKKFPLEFMWDVADPTPEGHLPLTNALRGTRLLEEVLNHPAFDAVDEQAKLRSTPASLFG